jgi:hypothetical protein
MNAVPFHARKRLYLAVILMERDMGDEWASDKSASIIDR